MARLGSAPEKKSRGLGGWISHLGVAAASILLVVTALSFFSAEGAPEVGDSTTGTVALEAASRAESTNDEWVIADIREVRSLDGDPVVVFGAGLVEGVRVGDRLEVETDEGFVGVEVVAVSSWVGVSPWAIEVNCYFGMLLLQSCSRLNLGSARLPSAQASVFPKGRGLASPSELKLKIKVLCNDPQVRRKTLCSQTTGALRMRLQGHSRPSVPQP